MSLITWLEDWYDSNCYDDWEQEFGVKISTLGTGGWLVLIDIIYTEYEHTPFDSVCIDRSDVDWISCSKLDGALKCAGGPKNLHELLQIVKCWMDDNRPTGLKSEK